MLTNGMKMESGRGVEEGVVDEAEGSSEGVAEEFEDEM